MELIPHCLTPEWTLEAFVVWLGLVSSRPLIHPVPYLPKLSFEAAPKCISGRTSYLRVRLAFHLYPQLIPYLCTGNGFGPSSRDYRDFNLAMGSSPGFGSNPNNIPGLLEAPPQALAHHLSLAQRIRPPPMWPHPALRGGRSESLPRLASQRRPCPRPRQSRQLGKCTLP